MFVYFVNQSLLINSDLKQETHFIIITTRGKQLPKYTLAYRPGASIKILFFLPQVSLQHHPGFPGDYGYLPVGLLPGVDVIKLFSHLSDATAK
jgi:hypothetical protein